MPPRAAAAPVRHLTTEELAERIGLDPRTVEGWRLSGSGPAFIRIGSSNRGRSTVRYRLADIEAWEQSLLREPGAA